MLASCLPCDVYNVTKTLWIIGFSTGITGSVRPHRRRNRGSKYYTNDMILKQLAYVPWMEVLWWISFQVMRSSAPYVDFPTVNISLALNAFCSNSYTSIPSALFGRYAVRVVPLYCLPGWGWSSLRTTTIMKHCFYFKSIMASSAEPQFFITFLLSMRY